MKTKTIIVLILLSGLVYFGMSEAYADQYGTGIAQAQDEDADARRLVRDLEEALKSGNQERIRLAHQRVNAHQQAAQILKQRPALQRQLKTATRPVVSRVMQPQATLGKTPPKETLARQAGTLKSPAGLSAESGFQGTASGMKQVSQPMASQIQGVSREGISSTGSRAEGVSLSPAAGMGSTGMQGFSSKPEGISKDIVAGVSSVSVKGVATETARGFDSKEQGVKTFQNTEKIVGTAVGAATTRFVPDVPDPPSSSGRQATSRASTPVRRTPVVQAAPQSVPSSPAPAAALTPAAPGAPSRTPPGFKPPSPVAQSLPALEQAASSSRSPEAPRSTASPEIIGRGPGGTGVIVPAKVREGANTTAGPPVSGSHSPEAPRSTASPEIIGRGPGGTGVIAAPRVREGANTGIGSPVPSPAGSSSPGSGSSSPFYSQPASSGVIKVNPPAPGSRPGGSASQEMVNIHDLAQQLRPKPPDPQQVQAWSDSIRRPGASDPPRQIEKFSGGDPRWTEINQRVTQASEPLFPNRTIPVKDPDLARLANPEQSYSKASADPGLGRLAGREPRPPTTTERMDAYQQAQQQAAQTNRGLADALRSGNQEQIDRAALQQRANPQAVRQANISETPEMRSRMNQPMANIQSSMEPGIKNRIAQQYGVSPNEVTVNYISNPSSGSKVHQDADVTIRVRGMDVPADVARPVVNEQFHRAAGGIRVAPGMSPDKFAESHYIETTDRLHRHSYGSSAAEGQQILHGPKTQPIRDVNQVAGAMADKYNVTRNEAIELTRRGQLPEAEVQRGLGMGQTVKQFDDHVQPRVEAAGGRVPAHVQRGMDILRDVREGRTSPVQAEAALRQMGETPDSITQKATGLLEAGQKLQGPGRGNVPDRVGNETFVQNVKDRMELNRLQREAAGGGSGGKGPGSGTAAPGGSATDTGRFEPIRETTASGGRGAAGPDGSEAGSAGTRTGQHALTEGRSSVRQETLTERVTETGRAAVGGIQKADQALGRSLGVGELAPDASRLRSGANTGAGVVLGGAAVVATGLEAESIGERGGAGLKDYLKGSELRERAQTERQAGFEQRAQILETQADRFQNQGKDKMLEAAKDEASLVGGIVVGGAIGAAAPVAGAIVGGAALGTAGGNWLLENTETGRKWENFREDMADGPLVERAFQAGEALRDDIGGMMGGQTRYDRDRAELTGRQTSYDRALERGAIRLQDGVTREDLMDYLRTHNPAPSDKDDYTAADYQAGLNELISRQTPAPPGSQPVAKPPDATEPGDAPPVKSRAEQDLADYQALQAIRNLQGGNKEPTAEPVPDKPPEVTVNPPPPPPPEPEPPDPDAGNRDFGSDYIASQIVNQFGGIQNTQQRQDAIAEYLRNLRDAERATNANAPTAPPAKPGSAIDANLQVALNTNVTGSFQQDRDQQVQQEAQQALGSISGTQAERAAAAQNQQMQAQSQIQTQGHQTTQAINATTQEFTAAQQTLQVTRQNSLGNILLGSLMGGLTSGIATGIDNFASGVGSGAGQQVSANWGIQPPPPPPPPTTGTPATTGTGSTGSQTTGTESTGSQTTGGQTGSTPQAPVQTTSTTSGTSTTITRPPTGSSTTIVRPPPRPPTQTASTAPSGPATRCNQQQVAGSDTADTRTIELGKTSGTFRFYYQTYSQKDQITLRCASGGTLYDTGCVGSSKSISVPFSCKSTKITATVRPNCAGGKGTRWNYTVYCP